MSERYYSVPLSWLEKWICLLQEIEPDPSEKTHDKYEELMGLMEEITDELRG